MMAALMRLAHHLPVGRKRPPAMALDAIALVTENVHTTAIYQAQRCLIRSSLTYS